MDRTIRSAPASIATTLYDANGDPVTAGGAVTAAVRDSAGVAIAGSPFSTSEAPTGTYTATVPAASLGVLDVYDVTWSLPGGQTRATQFEVVGGFLFSIDALQSFNGALATKTAAEIREIREAVEERFERVCRVSFTLRGRRATLSGRARTKLVLPDVRPLRIVAVTVDGTALTGGELAELKLDPDAGTLEWPNHAWSAAAPRNIVALYEHGHVTPPEPVRRAGLHFAKSILLPGGLYDERATGVFGDVGGFRLAIAGRDGFTGLPDVDAVLQQFGHMQAGVVA